MNKLLFLLATVAHLIPQPFGVSPVGATALYAGAYSNPKVMWLFPLLPLLIADLIGGFYDPTVMAFVYLGFALSTLPGRLLLSGRRTLPRYAFAVLAGAVIFYLVSNFSMWLVGMYPQTVTGLAVCYINGLPYLGTSILAGAFYSLVLFGLHSAMERRQWSLAPI